MRTSSPVEPAIRLDEEFSLPVNRCDPYNTVYVSPYTNTIVVAVSNGLLFMTLRQEKPLLEQDLLVDATNESSKRTEDKLFRMSLQITSAIDIEFQNEDPISKWRPSFVGGLAEGDAESYYFDKYLAQKPASRQQTSAASLSRSLCRASGAHVIKMFSVFVNHEKSSETGAEIVVAVTSTGGWYAFVCNQRINAHQAIWQRSAESWQSIEPLLRCAVVPEIPTKPHEVSQGYLKALHSVCTSDVTPAESNDGRVLIYVLNGLGQVLAYVMDATCSKSQSRNVSPASDGSNDLLPTNIRPVGNLLSLDVDSKAVSLCYVKQTQTLAFGCENGRVFLLNKITPFSPTDDDNNNPSLSFTSSQTIWPHSDISTDLIVTLPTFLQDPNVLLDKTEDGVVLVVAKGAFLTAWVLPLDQTNDATKPPKFACCHVDSFPIISIGSSHLIDYNANKERCIARFVVCTQKGVYIASLRSKKDDFELTCHRLLSVDEISSPLGAISKNNAATGGSSSITTASVVSSLNESFRKRHLSTNHWLFLGFACSPNLKYFIAATGIFSPCKASLLLAPPFSIKLFSKRATSELLGKMKSSGLPSENKSYWDDTLFELSSSLLNETNLIDLAKRISADRTEDVSVLRRYFTLLRLSCLAYRNGCHQASPPSQVLAALNAVKRSLVRNRIGEIIHRLPLDIESEQNIIRYHGYLSDLAKMAVDLKVNSSKQFSNKIRRLGDVAATGRQSCPICKSALVTKLVTGSTSSSDESVKEDTVTSCSCSNGHFFRPCSRSFFPLMPSASKEKVCTIMPLNCPLCGEVTLHYFKSIESKSLLEQFFNSLLCDHCVFCGSNVLP